MIRASTSTAFRWHVQTRIVPFIRPLTIARGQQDAAEIVHVSCERDGIVGWGEAAPQRFLGESTATVSWAVAELAGAVEDPWDWSSLHRARTELLGNQHPSAASAVEMAVLDWCARSVELPVWRLAGLDDSACPASSFTVGIGPVDEVIRQAADLVSAGWQALKVKLGGSNVRDEATVLRELSRAHPNVQLRVDANGGWSRSQAFAMLPTLADCGVTALEQPLALWDTTGLHALHTRSPVPIVLDESIRGVRDVIDNADRCTGVNIKISKVGGFLTALQCIRQARALGLSVMLGCMGETSLGLAPAVHLAPLADDVDLDGAFFLASDFGSGLHWLADVPCRPDGPGWGITVSTQTSDDVAALDDES